MPLHFSLVDDAMVSYRRVVDRIQGNFVLKSRVEELFMSINRTLEERRILAMEASPVRIIVIFIGLCAKCVYVEQCLF